MPTGSARLQLLGGVIALLTGLVWALQGGGLLPGSLMSGQRMWLVIGAAVMLAGLWLIRRGLRG